MNGNIEEQELLLRVTAASRILSVSKSKLYELIARDEVPHVKIGSSLRIPVEALRAWIEQKTAGTGKSYHPNRTSRRSSDGGSPASKKHKSRIAGAQMTPNEGTL